MEVISNESDRPPVRRSHRVLIAALALAVLLIAALTAALVVIPALSSHSQTVPEPLIYIADNTAYMACGASTIRLDNAVFTTDAYGTTLNGEFTEDQNWLFYIAIRDGSTGGSDLMRVATDGLHEPERVAQGVCTASISYNGQRVLYTSGMQGASADLYALDIPRGKPRQIAEGVLTCSLAGNGKRALYVCGERDTGVLYSWNFAGQPEAIADNVCSEYYGFSPNANNIYYVVKTSDAGIMAQNGIEYAAHAAASNPDTYTLYVKIGFGTAVEAGENTAGADAFFSGPSFGETPLCDNGQMRYFGEETLSGPPLYLFSPGEETAYFDPPSTIFTEFADGSFLFSSGYSLYYKAPGQRKERLSKYPYLFPLFGQKFSELTPDSEKRFFLLEDYSSFDDGYPEQVTVFELEIGGEKTQLCDMDSSLLSMTFDTTLTRLAYKRDGVLYVMQKENGTWSEPVMVSDNGFVEIHIYNDAFDSSGKTMYYLQYEQEDAESGGFYRYALAEHESTLLMQDVSEFYQVEDVPYAITSGDVLFRADNGEQLASEVRYIQPAAGGIHIFTQSGILFYGKDAQAPIELCTDADTLQAKGISYMPPLTDEIAAELEALCDDAQRCIDVLESGGIGSFAKYQERAEALRSRSDIPLELDEILNSFSSGFSFADSIATYTQYGDEAVVAYTRKLAIDMLSKSIQSCREYLDAN